MAIDEPTKRKRGTPAGDPQSAKTKMGQRMARQRLALLDDDDDFEPTTKGGMPAGDSESAKTRMGQRMALVHQRLSLIDNSSSISRHIAASAAAADDDDDDFEPMDDELAIGVVQQPIAVDNSDPHGNKIMRPQSVENEPGKRQGFRHKHKARRTITKAYKRRKTWRPVGSRCAKTKLEHKPMLVHSRRSSYGKSDKDVYIEMTRKRGRPASSKYAKSKMKLKQPLFDSSSSGEGKDKDGDFELDVSDDDVQKKYTSVLVLYGTALERALEVEKKLPAEGPSFVKLMQKSHVVRGFWLGVPVSFCKNHLPNDDVTIALEDEDGRSYDTKYLARKQGLSGGWHGFVVRHDLKVGDAVIFQLVEPKRFKVYILRENKFTTTDGALGLLRLDMSVENNMPEKGEETSDEDVKSKEDPEVTRVSNKASDDDSNDLFSEEAANISIISADPDPDFNAVKTFRTFKIAIDNSVIDRKLVPDRLLWTYYKLCDARKAFLHRRLPKHINPTLAAGVIGETVSIAEGIRAYPASSSSFEDLVDWKKTLESFELLGMDVGFMRKRVDDLLFLLDARPSADHSPERYEEVKLERARAAERVRALETKMESLKDSLEEMDMEMKEIAEKRRGHAMLKLAAAPW